jgi:hypothetical protein
MSGMNTAAAGMLLEMQLARERDEEIKNEFGGKTVSIVDQTQFRNVQINEGYQHKKVHRQRDGSEVGKEKKVVDMTVSGRKLNDEKKKRRAEEEARSGTKRCRVEIAPGIFANYSKEVKADKKEAKREKKREKKEKKKEKTQKKKKKKKETKREKKERKREKKRGSSSSSGSSSGSGSDGD